MKIPTAVDRYLSQTQVKYDLLGHKHSRNSMDTVHAAHLTGQQVAKAVVLRDRRDGRCLMAVIPAPNKLQLRWIKEDFDLDLELVQEAELAQLFPDCEPGAVPPFGQAYHLMTLWDERLDKLSELYFEAGDHEHLVHLRHEGFDRLFEGMPHGILSEPGH